MKISKLPLFRCSCVWRTLAWGVLAVAPVLEAADQISPDGNKGGGKAHHHGRSGRPSMGKHDFKALDKDGDGFLSFEEFSQSERLLRIDEEKRRKLFDFLDRNKDGKLHMRELRPAVPRWMSSVHKEFDRLDVNKSGSLDFVEFSKASQIAKMDERERRKLFKRLDRNKDQAIQRAELRGPGGPGNSREHKAHPKIDFEKYDTNQSGGLDFDEYSRLPWMSRIPEERRKMIFEKLDRDKNGEISPEEVKSAWADRRKHGPPSHARPHRNKPSRNGEDAKGS
jgi:Ca2+-binding EF-hand superfamily protein